MAGLAWVASATVGDTSWHVVNRLGGWVLPTACGVWAYGPFHVRRVVLPVNLAAGEASPLLDREVCPGCAAAVGVKAWPAAGLMGLRELATSRNRVLSASLAVATAADPAAETEPIAWPSEDPDGEEPRRVTWWRRGPGGVDRWSPRLGVRGVAA